MLDNWITEDDLVVRLGVSTNAARTWRKFCPALRRAIKHRTKARHGARPGYEYDPADVKYLETAPRELAPFTDDAGRSWLPISSIRDRYPKVYGNISGWEVGGCPLLPGRPKLLPTEFLCRMTGGNGKIIWIKFWEESVIAKAEAADRTMQNDDSDTATEKQAVKEFGLSRRRLRELRQAGQLRPWKETRLSERERNGDVERIPQEILIFSRAELRKVLKTLPSVVVDEELVTVSAAVEMTDGNFKINRLVYWETNGSPFLPGRARLTVKWRDAVTLAPHYGNNGVARRKAAKHYLRSEIALAYETYKNAEKTRGIYRDEDGGFWVTSGVAHERHGVYWQALDRWRQKGWLHVVERDREGPGPAKQAVITYFRLDGPRGLLRLAGILRDSPNHRIPAEVSRQLDKEVAVRCETMPVAESRTNGTAYRIPLERTEDKQLWTVTLGELTEALANLPDKTTPMLCEILELLRSGSNEPRERTPRKCPLEIRNNRIFLHGEQVQLDMTPERAADAIFFVGLLIERAGDWFSGGDIARAYPAKKDIRWERVRSDLPEAVKSHIESARKKGYRIRLA